MSKIKFLKIRDVKSPVRANKEDAGIDFFVPTFNADFVEQLIDKNPQLFEDSSNHNDNGMIYAGVCGTSSSISINSGNTTTVNYNTIDDATKDDEELIGFDPEKGPYFLLLPHNRVMIPSGIKSRMASPDRALIAANKSGVATKLGFVYGAQVVDSTYQGEIHISIINTSTKIVKVFQGQKLIQFIETPIYQSDIDITEGDSVKDAIKFYKGGFSSDRGEGGFGSSDEK